MKIEAMTPASEKGSLMPANPAAAPNAIMTMKASGTSSAAAGLRADRKAAHMPAPIIARMWSGPVRGCRKPDSTWPGMGKGRRSQCQIQS